MAMYPCRSSWEVTKMNQCSKDSVVILGAGGHAKVVIATLQAVGYRISALLDDDITKVGREIMHVPIAGSIARIEGYGFCKALIAIGDNEKRKKIAKTYDKYCDWITVTHPMAAVHESVKIDKGTIIFAGAVIQPDTKIGNHVIINTGATVDHDCSIGNYVHLAPGVHLSGNVTVGDGAFLGIGTVVIPGKTVGEMAIVGAGSVVIDDIPPFAKVAGVPATAIWKGLK